MRLLLGLLLFITVWAATACGLSGYEPQAILADGGARGDGDGSGGSGSGDGDAAGDGDGDGNGGGDGDGDGDGSSPADAGVIDGAGGSMATDAAVSADGGLPPTCAADWWDPAYRVRQRLTFDNAAGPTLDDFPVLVTLEAGRIAYADAASDGADLRFIDADGATVLDHEIETWDAAGTSLVWVRVPRIGAASDVGFIWMYYGNAAAGDVQDAAGVWSGSYSAVYHFAGGGLRDSSARLAAGVAQGATAAAGALGDGLTFDGNGDWVNLGNDVPLGQAVGGCTLSAWVRPNGVAGTDPLISIAIGGAVPTTNSRATLALVGATGVLAVGRAGDGDTLRTAQASAPSLDDGAFHLVTAVLNYAGDRIRVYVDGVERLSSGQSFGAVSSNTPSASAALGSQDDGSRDFFVGILDEVRISGSARDAAYVDAEFRSMTGQLIRHAAACYLR